MTDSIISAIRELYEIAVRDADEECVSISVFINSKGLMYELQHRTPEGLKRDGISMKNLCGDWIE